jgi:hypothetical protein
MPRWSLAEEAVERSGLLQVFFRRRWWIEARLENTRFSPPKSLDAFVNDSQERRETCEQEGEKIQVGVVPIHVQLRRAAGRLLVAGTPRGTCYFAPNICSSLPTTEKAPTIKGRGKLAERV